MELKVLLHHKQLSQRSYNVNSEVKLKSQLDKLGSGKGIINVGEPKLIELRQWWKNMND